MIQATSPTKSKKIERALESFPRPVSYSTSLSKGENMKSLVLALITVLAAPSFAADKPKCEKKIAGPALKRINKIFTGDSAETRTIEGVKPLHVGGFLENYVVLASDEVEPSEWFVIVETKTCRIKFIDVTNDGSVSDIWD